jgi:hypothetical protein
VPGIGKTTLARILMADAVVDGYEPIEVSHDIEEGWKMLDDSTKQIFLWRPRGGCTRTSRPTPSSTSSRRANGTRSSSRRRTTPTCSTFRSKGLSRSLAPRSGSWTSISACWGFRTCRSQLGGGGPAGRLPRPFPHCPAPVR